jgi:hypothetical protein
MKTLFKELQALSEAGRYELDTYNLILGMTNNEEHRMSLMLLDIERFIDQEEVDLSIESMNNEQNGRKFDFHEDIERHQFYFSLIKVKRTLREKLNLDFINRVHENRINWLRDDLANRAFIEALSKHGYISNKNYFKVYGNFIGMPADEETERIDWLRSQRLLIRLNGYLINEGIIGSTDQPWLMVANSYTWNGANFKTDSLKSDNSYMHESKHLVRGWDKLKELVIDTLQSFT